MRMLALVLGMISVAGVAHTAPVQDSQNAAQRPVLQMVTPDTVGVAEDVLPGLAESEPRIAAAAGGLQNGFVGLKVLVSKTGEVEEAVAFAGPPELAQAAVDGVQGWRYRPYLLNGEPREIEAMMSIGFTDGWGTRLPPQGPPPAVVPRGSLGPGPVRVATGVVAGLLEQPVAPVYPPIAKAAHVQGTVVLRAILSKTGGVEDLQVIAGPPMLRQSAMDAVRQWKYRPYVLNGVATRVQTTINVNFTFAEAKKPAPADGSGADATSPPADGK